MIDEIFDFGDMVVCDLCNTDYTNSDEKGGFLFGGTCVCPKCQNGFFETVKQSHEEKYIVAWAEKDESFKDFVLRIRNGDNTVRVLPKIRPL